MRRRLDMSGRRSGYMQLYAIARFTGVSSSGLRHWIANPAFVGSNPTSPFMGRQVNKGRQVPSSFVAPPYTHYDHAAFNFILCLSQGL